MSNTESCRGCVMPNLCLIACPNNQILDQMRHPVCEPPLEELKDAEQLLEIRFARPDDKPAKKQIE